MVLPLVPLVLIAIGSASGAGGVALGGKGAFDLKKARDELRMCEKRYLEERARTERAVDETNRLLADYGGQQQASLEAVVVRMGVFLRRHAKQVRESERLLVDGIDVTVGSVAGAAKLDADAVAWVRGAMGSAATGAGAAMGVTAAVGTYGVASTGVAISGLSGAAAESATLALLGGGSLASGGGGMALGATALNFFAIGPGLLVGGFVIKGQGDKARTEAREYEVKVNVAAAELSDTRTRLTAVDSRTEELADLLSQLAARAVESLDLLESETFDPEKHAARFQRTLNLVMAVRDVAATPVVDGAGELNDKTDGLQVKYRPMTKEADGDE
ncbi:hypothetical protein [Nocardioides donggukensis]|uniref:Uncharacterized protein n=1 Tax=Nocardioides donggukensis TaxID=2774019 RepID=A0A927PYS3_9ACTN|nr:hypothetical protein [Nocardioides donggukensis]MBD8868783.1 hypothetical protein [Nocardioides donggukensis]